MFRAFFTFLILAGTPGCHLIFPFNNQFSPDVQTHDASLENSVLDAKADQPLPPSCLLGHFAPPQRLENVNSARDDWSPTLTVDEQLLIFASWRDNHSQLYSAHRLSPAAPFSAPEKLPAVNSQDFDGSPSLSGDGLLLVFESTRYTHVGDKWLDYNIWVASRPDRESPFSQPKLLAGINTDAHERNPCLSRDGLSIYFSTDRNNANTYDLFWAKRTSLADDFAAPRALTELNSSWQERGPALSADGRLLFFLSNRPDGDHGLDIFVAWRDSVGEDFKKSNIRQLTELQTALDEYGLFFAMQSGLLYLNYGASTSGNPPDLADIWTSQMICDP